MTILDFYLDMFARTDWRGSLYALAAAASVAGFGAFVLTQIEKGVI